MLLSLRLTMYPYSSIMARTRMGIYNGPRELLTVISLTEAAERLYPRCLRVLSVLDAVENHVIDDATRPSGILHLVADTSIAVNVLPSLMVGFRDKFPSVHLDMSLTEYPVDLISGGYDLASASKYAHRRIAGHATT